jgi:hypothetical protein
MVVKRPVPYIQKIVKSGKKLLKYKIFQKFFLFNYFSKIIKIQKKNSGTKNNHNLLPTVKII